MRLFLFSLVLTLSWCGLAFGQDSSGYYATIVKVSDGDTWWSIRDGETIKRKYRGYKYDTPEPTQYGNAECDAEAMLGDIASEVAAATLMGKRLWHETGGTLDTRGKRIEARLILPSGEYFSSMMIDEKLAKKVGRSQYDWCARSG